MGLDCIMIFYIKSWNEIGDEIVWKFYVEIMGCYSNIILIDGVENVIIDGFKYLLLLMNSYCIVLSG